MKTPIYCPKCQKPLSNKFKVYIDGKEEWYKACYFDGFDCFDIEEQLASVSIKLAHNVWAHFDLSLRSLKIFNKYPLEEKMQLPFFEPDLSNYSQLVERLQTYIIFS